MTSFKEPTDLERALAAFRATQAAAGQAPSEDELVAFACGELGAERAEAVRDHLATSPEAARRVLDIRSSLAGEVPVGEEAVSSLESDEAWRRLSVRLGKATEPTSGRAASRPKFPRARPRLLVSMPLAATWLVVGLALGFFLAWLWLGERSEHIVLVEGDQEVKLWAEQRVPRGEEPTAELRSLRLGDKTARVRLLLAGLDYLGAESLEVCPEAASGQRPCRELEPPPQSDAPEVAFLVDQQILPPGVITFRLFARSRGNRTELAQFKVLVSLAK